MWANTLALVGTAIAFLVMIGGIAKWLADRTRQDVDRLVDKVDKMVDNMQEGFHKNFEDHVNLQCQVRDIEARFNKHLEEREALRILNGGLKH